VTVTVDATGLDRLAMSFQALPPRVQAECLRVVDRAAVNIKRDARDAVKGMAHAPAYPASITYDTRWDQQVYEAEIGPDKTRRQGALGNLIEYGSVNNPPRPHLGPALQAEAPRMAAALAAAIGRLL